MKIESLYIAGFGKFKDYRLVFSSGENIFLGENEVGKTTLMTFIKMMFYGSSAKGNDITKNPRKKYLPWDNTPMAGSIDFSHKGKLYRIERNFGASNTSDKVTLIDLDTGKRETYGGTYDLGAAFFGLSADAFERCVFIGQLNLGEVSGDASGELNSKLSSLALSGDEDVSGKLIASRLLSAKEELMSKSGKKGRYDIARQKLQSLNDELIASRSAEEEREALALKIENQKNRLTLILKDIDRINAALKATESKRAFRNLKDYIEVTDQITSLERNLLKADGTTISVSDLAKTQETLANYKLLKPRVADLEKEIALIEAEIESLSKEAGGNDPITLVREKVNAIENSLKLTKEEFAATLKTVKELNELKETNLAKKPKMRKGLILLSAVTFILALIPLVFKAYLFSLIGLVLFVVLAILCFTLKEQPKALTKEETELLENSEKNRHSLELNISTLSADLNAQNEILKALTSESDSAAALKEEKLSLIKNRKQDLEKLNEEIAESESLFALMFPKENMTASVSGMEIVLHAYKEYSRKVETAKTKLALLKADVGDLSKQAAEMKLAEIRQNVSDEEDPKVLEDRLLFKQNTANDIQKSIIFDEASARTKFATHRHPTEIEHEIEDLMGAIASQKDFCDSVDIALDALNTAFSKRRRSFGETLSKRTAEIFSALTNERYCDVNVSDEFDIAVESAAVFGSKEWQYLSSGTADQAYFALRLAVAELLSEDCGGLPLFIDDAFAQYDDTRLNKAIKFLEKYSKDNQVLYFTCHKAGLENKENVNTII